MLCILFKNGRIFYLWVGIISLPLLRSRCKNLALLYLMICIPFEFMIMFTSCITMGKVHRWWTFPKCRFPKCGPGHGHHLILGLYPAHIERHTTKPLWPIHGWIDDSILYTWVVLYINVWVGVNDILVKDPD
jgi:hypothetical protein